jgi:glycosyltransferase 2 family protein
MIMIKKIFFIALRISISIILLIFLFNKVDRKSLLEIIKNSDKPLLFLAFCIFFLSYILCLFRWEMLLKAVKIRLSLKRVIISFSGGVFFNLFLPSTIGGDLMRSIDLATHTKRPGEVVATVFLDRLSGYIGLVALALISLAAGWRLIQDKSILFFVLIITAVLIAVLLVLFNKFLYSKINKFLHSPDACPVEPRRGLYVADKIRKLLKNLHQEVHLFRHHKSIIVNNLILSIFIQSITPLTFIFIAFSLGLKVNIVYFFIFLPVINAITLLPISIGGLGLRDATTIYFFAKAGVGRDLAFAMSLINFLFILVCGGLGGLIYVLTLHHRRIQHHK